MEFYSEFKTSHLTKCICKRRLQNVEHFIQNLEFK